MKRLFVYVVKFLCIISLLSVNSCSNNILSEFANQLSDEARLEAAKKNINKGEYQEAIDQINLMSTSFAGERSVVALKASAYAGLCGLNFLDLIESVNNIGSVKFLLFLMKNFPNGTTAKMNSCISAENLLESISSNAALRTSDENILLAFVSLAKIGVILSKYADYNNGAGSDGAVDGTYDACTVGDTPGTAAPDSVMQEVGASLVIAMESLNNSGSTLASSQVSSLTTICSSLTALGYNFCSKTDPTAFTATDIKGVRSIIKESSAVGISAGCVGDLTACNCP